MPGTRSLHPVSSPHQGGSAALRRWPKGLKIRICFLPAQATYSEDGTSPLSCPDHSVFRTQMGNACGDAGKGLKLAGGQATKTLHHCFIAPSKDVCTFPCNLCTPSPGSLAQLRCA